MANQIDIPDLSLSGIGGVTIPCLFPSTSTTTTGVLAANNQVRVKQFILPFSITVRKICFRVETLAAGGFMSVGIYDSAGRLIFSTGAQSTAATGNFTTGILDASGRSVTEIVLPAGVYYSGYTADNTTSASRALTDSGFDTIFGNLNANRCGVAANPSVGGVLPQTLGVITSSTLNSVLFYIEP